MQAPGEDPGPTAAPTHPRDSLEIQALPALGASYRRHRPSSFARMRGLRPSPRNANGWQRNY
jgi:hypothetical protein